MLLDSSIHQLMHADPEMFAEQNSSSRQESDLHPIWPEEIKPFPGLWRRFQLFLCNTENMRKGRATGQLSCRKYVPSL